MRNSHTLRYACTGKIVFELMSNHVPRTAENFRALCTGEKGVSERGVRLHYKGSCFHRAMNVDDGPPRFINESADGTGRDFEIWRGMFIHGGDIEHGDGSGGESIYGEHFEDEECSSPALEHRGPGWVSMAGTMPMRERAAEERVHVPHRNHSQFLITTQSANGANGGSHITHFDGRHVVFARVVKGMELVHRINKLPTLASRKHALTTPVLIEDCGQMTAEGDDAAAAPSCRTAASVTAGGAGSGTSSPPSPSPSGSSSSSGA